MGVHLGDCNLAQNQMVSLSSRLRSRLLVVISKQNICVTLPYSSQICVYDLFEEYDEKLGIWVAPGGVGGGGV